MQQKQRNILQFTTQMRSNINLFQKLTSIQKFGVKKANNSTLSKSLSIMTVIHTLLGYILLQNDHFSLYCQLFQQIIQSAQLFLRIASILNYIVIIITGVSLVLISKPSKASNISQILLKNVLEKMEIITTLSMFFSSFMSYINFQVNITSLVLVSILKLFQNIAFGNYQIKNCLNYQISQQLSLKLEILSILTLIINTVLLNYFDLSTYCNWSILKGTLLLYWYSTGGNRLYFSRTLSIILRVYSALTVSLSVEFVIVLLNLQGKEKVLDFVEWGIAFVVIYIYFHVLADSKTLQISTVKQYIRSGSVKQLQLRLFQVFQELDSKAEFLSFVTGVIDQHSRGDCVNPSCWLKKRNLFEAIYQLSSSQASFTKAKDSICKEYIKCVYQTVLRCNKTAKVTIDYCQFMITEFDDLYSYYSYLQKQLSPVSMNLLQKIKVAKLRSILQQKYNSSRKQPAQDSTNLLDLLRSQYQFNEIFRNISSYCHNQLQFYDFLTQKQIDIKQVKDQITYNCDILIKMDKKWSELSHFFDNQQKLYLIYFLYKFFLKNQKIKAQTLRFITQKLQHMREILMQSLKNKGKGLSVLKFNLLFDPCSCIIVAVFKDSQLIFHKTSQYFGALTLYEEQQLRNAPLSTILPTEVQQTHSSIVLQSLQNGKLSLQGKQRVKSTYFLNKKQQKVSSIVFFNLFLDFQTNDETFKFIAFIKKESALADEKSLMNESSFEQKSMNGIMPYRSSTNLSLMSESQNIFLKEQNIQTLDNNPKNNQIKTSLRIFTFSSIGIVIALFILTNIAANKQIKLATTWNYTLFLYRFPMGLIKNYLKLSFKIGDPALTYINIGYSTNNLKQYIKDQQTIEFLVDESINTEAKYPPYKTNQVNKGIAYDQIDIFYVVMECLMTLSSIPSINRTGYEFTQLDSYIKPGYDTMINNTKIQFHYKLTEQISSSQFQQKTILAISVAIFTVLAINLLRRYVIINKDNNEAFKTLFKFKKNQVKKIIKYWSKVKQIFQDLFIKQQADQQSNGFLMKYLSTKDLGQKNNSKQKWFVQSENKNISSKDSHLNNKSQKEQDFKVKVTFLFAILVAVVPVLTFQTYNIFQFTQLLKFQAAGFQISRFYPANTVIGYALIAKYYSYVFPNQTTFQMSRYDDIISDLKIIAKTDYLADIDEDSDFHKKIKNYFFGNPCTYNPAVLVTANSSLSKCVNYSNRSLTSGLIPYFRYVTPQVEDYLSGRVNYTVTQMDNIISGFALSGFYFSDIISTWTSEFNDKLSSLKDLNFFMAILITAIILVIHFAVFEWWFLGYLVREHRLVRDILDNLVPGQIITHEKLVKHKFQRAGALVTL